MTQLYDRARQWFINEHQDMKYLPRNMTAFGLKTKELFEKRRCKSGKRAFPKPGYRKAEGYGGEFL
jgi:hypothetical protein